MPKKWTRPGPEVREKQIIDAAVEVFGEKSYHWATTREIAEKSGLTEGMLFFYFDSKKKLYREMVKKVSDDALKALLRGKPPTDDIRTFFKMTTRNLITFFEEEPIETKVLMKLMNMDADPELREEARNLLNGIFVLLTSLYTTAKEQGFIPEEIKPTTSAIYTIGFTIAAALAQTLDLDWFKGEHDDILTITDTYIDFLSQRE